MEIKKKSQKINFLYALIATIIIFNLGIFFGYQLEASRTDKIENWYLESEIELLDQRLQKDAFEIMDLDCDLMIEENIKFADRIFQEALMIQRYEDANKISSEIVSQHKRYDLLRTLFWINSMRIKEKCGSDYHNVVYFYQYQDKSVEQRAKQDFFSNLLVQVKEQKGSDVMLIPIAADNELASITLLLEKYGLEEFPVIFIDEKVAITDLQDIEDIMKYLD